ncbi:hypothetical protein P280DRAFT_362284, partial [Massarina eburnea CBS 473.64]
DVTSRRTGAGFAKRVLALLPEEANVKKTPYTATARDGYEIPIFAYHEEKGRGKGAGNDVDGQLKPAVLYLHGGGMIFGSTGLFERAIKGDVDATGVAHFSVDYRVAPESPHPIPVSDCYDALTWLHSHARDFGIDNSRISVRGLSAGGGLAAGVCLMARDGGLQPPIAKQILECPMLDDRNTEPSPSDPLSDSGLVTWSWDDNWTGWKALLGEGVGGKRVDVYAAPARAENLGGLPDTYVDVGTLDIFARECEQYVERLREAGVKVEWHLYKGVPHGFEFRGMQSEIAKRAAANRRAAI